MKKNRWVEAYDMTGDDHPLVMLHGLEAGLPTPAKDSLIGLDYQLNGSTQDLVVPVSRWLETVAGIPEEAEYLRYSIHSYREYKRIDTIHTLNGWIVKLDMTKGKISHDEAIALVEKTNFDPIPQYHFYTAMETELLFVWASKQTIIDQTNSRFAVPKNLALAKECRSILQKSKKLKEVVFPFVVDMLPMPSTISAFTEWA